MAMSTYNFNVPLEDVNGEPVLVPKTDKKKLRVAPNGAAQEQTEVDDNGIAIMEPVKLNMVLARILNAQHKGDEDADPKLKVQRGKLARKIANHGEVGYTAQQIVLLEEFAAKMGSIELLTQLDNIINGTDEIGAAANTQAA